MTPPGQFIALQGEKTLKNLVISPVLIYFRKKGTSCFFKKHVKQVQKGHDLAVPLGTVLRL